MEAENEEYDSVSDKEWSDEKHKKCAAGTDSKDNKEEGEREEVKQEEEKEGEEEKEKEEEEVEPEVEPESKPNTESKTEVEAEAEAEEEEEEMEEEEDEEEEENNGRNGVDHICLELCNGGTLHYCRQCYMDYKQKCLDSKSELESTSNVVQSCTTHLRNCETNENVTWHVSWQCCPDMDGVFAVGDDKDCLSNPLALPLSWEHVSARLTTQRHLSAKSAQQCVHAWKDMVQNHHVLPLLQCHRSTLFDAHDPNSATMQVVWDKALIADQNWKILLVYVYTYKHIIYWCHINDKDATANTKLEIKEGINESKEQVVTLSIGINDNDNNIDNDNDNDNNQTIKNTSQILESNDELTKPKTSNKKKRKRSKKKKKLTRLNTTVKPNWAFLHLPIVTWGWNAPPWTTITTIAKIFLRKLRSAVLAVQNSQY
ncbi:hypothetical protein RFI_26221 [Reticulomyxa filosa]|uniref:Uncharacterized protein n=1 Tax=Reticulomyxa filosa TaxID=46433 RepID=X6MDN2_RETFI|nr:hypothetical protein RFI_26221 [Reticulomyxa filosa]|eukprot:ETO11155.1 hypothetical protein RFI_26221 [Reticulomyxa filosa]